MQNLKSTPTIAAIGNAKRTPKKPNSAPPANNEKITQESDPENKKNFGVILNPILKNK